MRLRTIYNGGTDSESRIYETGDDDWPFHVETPRGAWKCSDLPPALMVANRAGKDIPRKPIVFHDIGTKTAGIPA